MFKRMFENLFVIPTRQIMLTEIEVLSFTAIEKVLQYYRDIDAGNLQKAVLRYFSKQAIYQRNTQTYQGLHPQEGSIRTFYENGRGLVGEHTISRILIPQKKDLVTFNNQLLAEALPPLPTLKANQIPVLAYGQYIGTQTLNGQSNPVNVLFTDYHVIAPNQNNTVPSRYSFIYKTNQPNTLAKV